MQRKILFIINPIAGSGRALNYREKIADYLNGTDIKYEIVLTESSGHATEIAKATAFEDFDTCLLYTSLNPLSYPFQYWMHTGDSFHPLSSLARLKYACCLQPRKTCNYREYQAVGPVCRHGLDPDI